jgi:hypothetical protein
MATEIISRIENIVHEAPSLPPEKREELLALVAALRKEMDAVAPDRAQAAHEIAVETHALAEQALAPGAESKPGRPPLRKITDSLNQFEDSHPRLVQVTNAVCTALSNLGI